MFAKTSVLALATLASLASANVNWGATTAQRDATSSSERASCSDAGSFLVAWGMKSICSSPQTRSRPQGNTCPFDWFFHTGENCCIPPTEVCQYDCGEDKSLLLAQTGAPADSVRYTFDKTTMQCQQTQSSQCDDNQWWHPRSSSCCDNDWQQRQGDCPPNKQCPTGWYWCESTNQCLPQTPRTPQPDCTDWNEGSQCCGGPQPSGIPDGGSKRKRRDLRSTAQLQFAQSDLDKTYCPGKLHACSVESAGSEWAYECIDPATELEACGGCVSTGEGVDCTKIAHAASVGCEKGVCAVYSCKSGFAANGTVCSAI